MVHTNNTEARCYYEHSEQSPALAVTTCVRVHLRCKNFVHFIEVTSVFFLNNRLKAMLSKQKPCPEQTQHLLAFLCVSFSAPLSSTWNRPSCAFHSPKLSSSPGKWEPSCYFWQWLSATPPVYTLAQINPSKAPQPARRQSSAIIMGKRMTSQRWVHLPASTSRSLQFCGNYRRQARDTGSIGVKPLSVISVTMETTAPAIIGDMLDWLISDGRNSAPVWASRLFSYRCVVENMSGRS
jgi:hypothetical protein